VEPFLKFVMETWGIAGVAFFAPIIGLVWFVRAYFKREKVHAKELEFAQGKVSSVQDARVKDTQKVIDKLMELAGEQASLNKETNLLLANMNSVLERLSRGG
jgi:hypothetical protein